MKHLNKILIVLGLLLGIPSIVNAQQVREPILRGTPVWYPVTLDFEGPTCSEDQNNPNPFLDFRMDVCFMAPDGSTMTAPGFFAGDGKGNGTGNIWRCRFNPDQAGIWNYAVSFRYGVEAAVSLDRHVGTPNTFDGATGRFSVLPRNLTAPGLLRDGRLEYVGEYYLKARDGDYFIKTGTNSPENFFAYKGFDDVQDNGNIGIIHEYAPHIADWRLGDPYFVSNSGGDSRGIIGALNYLGDQGVNSIYFLPMNLGGDGQDTCPFIGYSKTRYNKTHYDVSRMHQWNIVLNHAQEQGILVHFVLAETEWGNENWLDNGNVGLERKLYFRELSARFGYLNGVKWNLSEENDFSVEDLREMATYIDIVDPYDHTTAVHTRPDDFSDYNILFGDPLFDAASMQYFRDSAAGITHVIRFASDAAGRKWLIDMDENGFYTTGLTDTNSDDMRKRVLYDVLFSNGNIEWYCGYHSLPLGGDVRIENFRTREDMWRYSRIAREFLQENFDLAEIRLGDHLVDMNDPEYGEAEVVLQPDEKMAIFVAKGLSPLSLMGPTVDMINLSGTYSVKWISPRTGQVVAQGPDVTQSGTPITLDVPVTQFAEDWIIFLERK